MLHTMSNGPGDCSASFCASVRLISHCTNCAAALLRSASFEASSRLAGLISAPMMSACGKIRDSPTVFSPVPQPTSTIRSRRRAARCGACRSMPARMIRGCAVRITPSAG
jgi:hypothetical protein